MKYPNNLKGLFIQPVHVPELHAAAENQIHHLKKHPGDKPDTPPLDEELFLGLSAAKNKGLMATYDQSYIARSCTAKHGIERQTFEPGSLVADPSDVGHLIAGLHRQAASLLVSAWLQPSGSYPSVKLTEQASYKIDLAFVMHTFCLASAENRVWMPDGLIEPMMSASEPVSHLTSSKE